MPDNNCLWSVGVPMDNHNLGDVMRYYRPLHFQIEELVSPKVFNSTQDKEKLWQLFDADLLYVLDRLHNKFGTVIINNWKWGGNRDLCGLRHLWLDRNKLKAEGIYMDLGMHEYGKAVDCVFKTTTAEQVRQYILSHPADFPEIRGIELNVSWLHIDTRNRDRVITF